MRTKDPQKASQIRTQALRMFARDGLDGFSMQRLAKAAGVSPATLYIHFEDKDDLLFQLYREQHDAYSERILAGFDPESRFEDGLRILWRNRLGFARENPASQRFLDQILYSPYHKGFAARLPPVLPRAMEPFVQGALERGEIFDLRRLDPSVDFPIEAFWSLAYAPLYQLIDYELRGSGPGDHHRKSRFRIEDEFLEQVLQRVLQGLRPATRAPGRRSTLSEGKRP